ncbi:MAG: hypothetical protein BWK79_08180 [Beggiatoa sp. IS2]|nr:MAG: hypothetical protein BWK79_08180 [Beggiatoa sp. IS2]
MPDLTTFKRLSNLDSVGYQNQIPVEPYCFEILTPEEIETLTTQILLEVKNSEIAPDKLSTLDQTIQNFKQQWQQVFYRFGHQSRGELAYQTLILDFKEQIASKVSAWLAVEGKGKKAIEVIDSMLFTSDRPILKHRNRKSLFLARTKHQLKSKLTDELQKNFRCPEFEKPLFIVSAPRAGSTLLFETLSQFTELWTIAEESHEIIEGIPEFHPSAKNFSSNRLTAIDTTPILSSLLRERFAQQLQNSTGQAYVNIPIEQRPTHIRFLEKTPKNALRIPLLQSVFPQALFIYLYRNPYENISSLVEGWRSRRFIAYHRLPEWPHREWSFLLPSDWYSLQESSLVEIATYQWKAANACILDDLQHLPSTAWYAIHYTDFIREPKKAIKAISKFAGLHWSHSMEQLISTSLPVSQLTLSAPAPDKWRKHEQEIAVLLPTLEPVIQLAESKFLRLGNSTR